MSLDERFQAAVDIVQKLPKDGPVSTSNDQKLKFYSLYKQATIGDVNTDRPGIFSFVERAKWDAWKGVEGTSQADAKEKYIEVLLEMFDKIGEEVNVGEWLSGPELDPSIKQNLALLGKVPTN
ncbi:Acyl CoA binding protein [Aphelenchoides fujianensis]|nr:Acyl CoA binding protein [Aphelenchoides fujianensis]